MLIQEVVTDLPPREVIARAREFFTTRLTPYAGFADEESDSHIHFQCEAGEVAIGTAPQEGHTLVRGSSSRLHHEISQFFTTLANPEAVQQNVVGPGVTGAG